MNIWFRIGQRQFCHDGDGAIPFLNLKLDIRRLLIDAGALKATSGTENASITLTLDNKMGQCTRLFADPPLGAIVPVYGDADLQFEGTLMQIDLSATDCKITVQA